MAVTVTALETFNSVVAGTTATTAATITAVAGNRDYLLVFIGADNSATSGASAISSVADSGGVNVYTQQAIINYSPGGAVDDGITLGIYTCPVTADITAGTITVTFSTSVTAKVIQVARLTPASGETLSVIACDTIGSTGNTTTHSAPTVSVTSGDVIFGVAAVETNATTTGDSDTTNGSWTASSGAVAAGGTADTSAGLRRQYKVTTGTGNQSWAATTVSAADSARSYIVFRTTVTDITVTNLANGTSITSTTTVATGATVTGVAASGDWFVALVAAANSGTSGAAPTITLADGGGTNVYTQRAKINYTPTAAASDGATLGIYTAPVTADITNGTITATFSPAVPEKAIQVYLVRPPTGETISVTAVDTTGSTGNATSLAAATVSVTSGDVIFGAAAVETDDAITGDSDTTNGSWSSVLTRLADAGVDIAAMSCISQYKLVNATGNQSWAATVGTARDSARSYIVLGAAAAAQVIRAFDLSLTWNRLPRAAAALTAAVMATTAVAWTPPVPAAAVDVEYQDGWRSSFGEPPKPAARSVDLLGSAVYTERVPDTQFQEGWRSRFTDPPAHLQRQRSVDLLGRVVWLPQVPQTEYQDGWRGRFTDPPRAAPRSVEQLGEATWAAQPAPVVAVEYQDGWRSSFGEPPKPAQRTVYLLGQVVWPAQVANVEYQDGWRQELSKPTRLSPLPRLEGQVSWPPQVPRVEYQDGWRSRFTDPPKLPPRSVDLLGRPIWAARVSDVVYQEGWRSLFGEPPKRPARSIDLLGQPVLAERVPDTEYQDGWRNKWQEPPANLQLRRSVNLLQGFDWPGYGYFFQGITVTPTEWWYERWQGPQQHLKPKPRFEGATTLAVKVPDVQYQDGWRQEFSRPTPVKPRLEGSIVRGRIPDVEYQDGWRSRFTDLPKPAARSRELLGDIAWAASAPSAAVATPTELWWTRWQDPPKPPLRSVALLGSTVWPWQVVAASPTADQYGFSNQQHRYDPAKRSVGLLGQITTWPPQEPPAVVVTYQDGWRSSFGEVPRRPGRSVDLLGEPIWSAKVADVQYHGWQNKWQEPPRSAPRSVELLGEIVWAPQAAPVVVVEYQDGWRSSFGEPNKRQRSVDLLGKPIWAPSEPPAVTYQEGWRSAFSEPQRTKPRSIELGKTVWAPQEPPPVVYQEGWRNKFQEPPKPAQRIIALGQVVWPAQVANVEYQEGWRQEFSKPQRLTAKPRLEGAISWPPQVPTVEYQDGWRSKFPEPPKAAPRSQKLLDQFSWAPREIAEPPIGWFIRWHEPPVNWQRKRSVSLLEGFTWPGYGFTFSNPVLVTTEMWHTQWTGPPKLPARSLDILGRPVWPWQIVPPSPEVEPPRGGHWPPEGWHDRQQDRYEQDQKREQDRKKKLREKARHIEETIAETYDKAVGKPRLKKALISIEAPEKYTPETIVEIGQEIVKRLSEALEGTGRRFAADRRRMEQLERELLELQLLFWPTDDEIAALLLLTVL